MGNKKINIYEYLVECSSLEEVSKILSNYNATIGFFNSSIYNFNWDVFFEEKGKAYTLLPYKEFSNPLYVIKILKTNKDFVNEKTIKEITFKEYENSRYK